MAKLTHVLGLMAAPLALAACTQTAGGPPPGMTAAQGAAYCTKLTTVYSEYVAGVSTSMGGVGRGGGQSDIDAPRGDRPMPGRQHRRRHSGAAARAARQQSRGAGAMIRFSRSPARLAGLALLPLLAAACTQTASGPPPGMTAAQATAYCSKLSWAYGEYVASGPGRQRGRRRQYQRRHQRPPWRSPNATRARPAPLSRVLQQELRRNKVPVPPV